MESEKSMNPIKEVGMESRENPFIFVVYRDNDLFDKWIPRVVNMLQAMGKRVEIKNFPKESEHEEIRDWQKEHADQFKNAEYLSDGTCTFCERGIRREDRKILGGQLDKILDEATASALVGSDYAELLKKGGDKKKASSIISSLVSKIIANGNMPQRVYILQEALMDHGPFWESEDAQGSIRKQIEAAQTIKSWLINGGISEENIEILSSGRKFENKYGEVIQTFSPSMNQIDKNGNWIIKDRHVSLPITHAVKLQFPLPNFYEDLRDQDLISDLDQAVKSNLEGMIRKIFE